MRIKQFKVKYYFNKYHEFLIHYITWWMGFHSMYELHFHFYLLSSPKTSPFVFHK